MFQFGYGVERDSKLSVKYYKRAAMMGKHVKAYQKCGDYYYSINDKRSAMTFYKKAAELGDLQSYNNIGLMFEMGFDDKLPEPEKAIENYKFAHYKGNSDATINLAIYYLNGRFMKPDQTVGKALLTQAYKDRNPRSVDCMLTYGLIKNKNEVDGFI